MSQKATIFLSSVLVLSALDGTLCDDSVGLEFVAYGATAEHWVTEGVREPYKVYSQVYYSTGFSLKPGQMLFTDPGNTPVPMPGDGRKDYAILGVLGDIAKDAPGNGKQRIAAPLSEVYDHHWIVMDNSHRNLLCPYGPNYVFGIGAESRDTPVHFPKGHGYFVKAGDQWGANIHLLRTDAGKYLKGDTPHSAVQQCNECFYAPSKGAGCSPQKNGTFQCCGENCYDGSCSCPTTPAAKTVPATTYYLRYEVNYTYDLDALTSVDTGVYTTPSCKTFYEVYQNDEQPETVSSTTFKVPVDAELMLAIGHQHVGARNISLFHNEKFLCSSQPQYGTEEGVAGNEKGYLVHMSTCYDADQNQGQGYVLRAGDTLRLDSWYWVGSDDPVLAPNPGGTHLNVMGYLYTVYKTLNQSWPHPPTGPAPTAGCKQALQKYCGSFIGFTNQCIACLKENEKPLRDAGCSVDEAWGVCSFMGPAGNMMDGQKRRIEPIAV
jgi:hypothetical protein